MDKVVWQQEHQLWNMNKVKSVIADHSNAISFFCGGSRNFHRFIDLLDGVFVLDVDLDTLKRRLASRPGDEFGGRPVECLNWLCFNDTVKHPSLNNSAKPEARRLAKIRILLRCAFASSEVYEHVEIAEFV
jgi:hypothetical protein